MAQVFDESGKVTPVTLIKAGPMVIAQIKTKEKDGYEAVQVGFGERKIKNIKKPQLGHLKKFSTSNIRWMREFRIKDKAEYNPADEIKVSVFQEGDKIVVSGISKGKGFQGVVKRHGFHGGPRAHGQKHSEREPGSIGATGPQKVAKGQKMPGRMGGDRVTIKNLKVLKVDLEIEPYNALFTFTFSV